MPLTKLAVPSMGSRTHCRPVLAWPAAFLLAQEADVRMLLLQIAADSVLDLDVDVGHHVAIAFGAHDLRLTFLDDLSGDIHCPASDWENLPG